MSQQENNLLGVLQSLFRWRKPILRLVLLTLLGSIIISLFLPNYYKSTTTFYAASTDLFMPDKVFGSAEDMRVWGSGDDIDHLMTIGYSNELIDYMIKKFDLYNHYEIDPTNEKSHAKIREHFLDLYGLIKTKHDAVELSIEDKDRNLATQMAKAARMKIDSMAQKLIKDSQAKMLSTIAANMTNKKIELRTLDDSLSVLRKKFGVFNVESQSEIMGKLLAESQADLTKKRTKLEILEKSPNIPKDTITYLRADVKSLEKQLSELTSPDSESLINVKRFNEGAGSVEVLTALQQESSKQLGFNAERFMQIQSAYNSPISAVHLVEEAGVPVEKSRPKRSIIVLTATLAALLFGLIAALLLENYKEINWKNIKAEDRL